MSPLRILSLLAALALPTSFALAQNAAPQMQEKPAAMPQGGNSGTAQDHRMGASGGKATSPGNPDVPDPPDSPDKQPPVGTGADLNGPPKAFPSNKAPE